MEWPYDHPRPGGMPPDYKALSAAEYPFRSLPYAQSSRYEQVTSYVHGWAEPITAKTSSLVRSRILIPEQSTLRSAPAWSAAR